MGRSSNDDRSDRYNPNNDAYWAAEANESSQTDDDDDLSQSIASEPLPKQFGTSVLIKSFDNIHTESDRLFAAHFERHRQESADQPPRNQLGLRVLDRTSHVLAMLSDMLVLSKNYMYEESATSASRKETALQWKAASALLREKATDPKDRDSIEKTTAAMDNHLDYPLDSYRKEPFSVAHLTIRRSHPTYSYTEREVSLWDAYAVQCPTPLPAPQFVQLPRRQVLHNLMNAVAIALRQCADKPAVFSWNLPRPTCGSTSDSPIPGIFEVSPASGDDEVFEQTLSANQFDDRSYRGLVLQKFVFALPTKSDSVGAVRINADVVETVFGSLRWLLEAVPDWIDPRIILNAALHAAAECELAAAPFLVFGLHVDFETKTLSSKRSAALNLVDARRIRNAMTRGRCRAIVLPTPPPSGFGAWKWHASV